MSDSVTPSPGPGELRREDMLSALFAGMVVQQTQMTMLYLGRMPHPETGQPVRDLEAARMFIDQLEMLEAKTKGNLSKEEAMLLKQSLSSARLAFVDAVEETKSEKAAEKPGSTGAASDILASKDASESAETPAGGAASQESDERKKFVKKY